MDINPNTSPSFFRKLINFFVRTTIGLVCLGALLGAAWQQNWPKTLLPERVVIKEVPAESPEFEELVKEIPDTYGIPAEVVQVILQKESSGGKQGLKRYEAHHLERYGKRISSDTETAREYASSHCPFQIMGWHLKFAADGSRQDRGNWYDLYNPETCVREFARVWIECEKQHKGKEPFEKYYRSFECYNGSEQYAREAITQLSRLAVKRIGA